MRLLILVDFSHHPSNCVNCIQANICLGYRKQALDLIWCPHEIVRRRKRRRLLELISMMISTMGAELTEGLKPGFTPFGKSGQ